MVPKNQIIKLSVNNRGVILLFDGVLCFCLAFLNFLLVKGLLSL